MKVGVDYGDSETSSNRGGRGGGLEEREREREIKQEDM